MRISACMIVQDEERRLPAALDSLGFCDEVIVVDGGSHDRTVQLARARGAHVIESPWPGFAAQRNVALDAASGEWVIELDADERVSPQLRAAIERLLSDDAAGADVARADVAVCPLRNRFLGGWLGPSAKYPSYRTRVFRRGAYRHDEARQVHEGIEPRERPIVLDGDLQHELACSWGEALGDAWRYARLESAHIVPTLAPGSYAVGIVLRPSAKLIYRLALDGGWHDGWRGLVKVTLDAGSDALVWTLVLLRALRAAGRPAKGAAPDQRPADQDEQGARLAGQAPAGAGHFGRRPAGPAKVIALAGRGKPARKAASWLAELASAGVDVALLCEEGSPKDGSLAEQAVPLTPIRLTPLSAMRAVDVEMQIRTAHALVAFGARAKLVRRLLPGALRPRIAGVEAETEPSRAIERLRAAVR
jgi:Glycosyl transferase family 2